MARNEDKVPSASYYLQGFAAGCHRARNLQESFFLTVDASSGGGHMLTRRVFKVEFFLFLHFSFSFCKNI
jgi:hypothetical protein